MIYLQNRKLGIRFKIFQTIVLGSRGTFKERQGAVYVTRRYNMAIGKRNKRYYEINIRIKRCKMYEREEVLKRNWCISVMKTRMIKM